MTPTSRTGTYKKTDNRCQFSVLSRQTSGFTLFELIIVIFIISLTTAIIMPSLWETGDRVLKNEAKHIAGTLRYLYDEATGKKTPYILTFNIDEDSWSFKSEKESRNFKLKSNVMFKTISVPSLGEVPEGEVIIEFGPLGPAEPLSIHLTKDELDYTVIFNHISGRAKIYKGEKILK